MLTDCKNASDKPSDNTLRLTLVRTPGTRGGYADQGTQDLGHHDILFGLAGHSGDWREGQTDWQAYRLNDPLVAFESTKHSGSLGKQFSLVKVNNSRIRMLALKKAELSDAKRVGLPPPWSAGRPREAPRDGGTERKRPIKRKSVHTLVGKLLPGFVVLREMR